MKRRDHLALVLIFAARLNGAVVWVTKHKSDVPKTSLFCSSFESQFRCPKTPLSHDFTGLIAMNPIAEFQGRTVWRDGGY